PHRCPYTTLFRSPLFSGVGLRIALFIVLWAVTTIFIMRCAKKVKADPSKCDVVDLEAADKAQADYIDLNNQELQAFSSRYKCISIALLAVLSIMIYDVFTIDCFIDE